MAFRKKSPKKDPPAQTPDSDPRQQDPKQDRKSAKPVPKSTSQTPRTVIEPLEDRQHI